MLLIFGISDGCGLEYCFILAKEVIRRVFLFGFLMRNDRLRYLTVTWVCSGLANIFSVSSSSNFVCSFNNLFWL